MRNRYYNPGIQRFIQRDPARNGLNHYAAFGADPINFSDPSGLEGELNPGWFTTGETLAQSEGGGGSSGSGPNLGEPPTFGMPIKPSNSDVLATAVDVTKRYLPEGWTTNVNLGDAQFWQDREQAHGPLPGRTENGLNPTSYINFDRLNKLEDPWKILIEAITTVGHETYHRNNFGLTTSENDCTEAEKFARAIVDKWFKDNNMFRGIPKLKEAYNSSKFDRDEWVKKMGSP